LEDLIPQEDGSSTAAPEARAPAATAATETNALLVRARHPPYR